MSLAGNTVLVLNLSPSQQWEILVPMAFRKKAVVTTDVDFATWRWRTYLLECTTLSPPHSCLNKRALFS